MRNRIPQYLKLVPDTPPPVAAPGGWVKREAALRAECADTAARFLRAAGTPPPPVDVTSWQCLLVSATELGGEGVSLTVEFCLDVDGAEVASLVWKHHLEEGDWRTEELPVGLLAPMAAALARAVEQAREVGLIPVPRARDAGDAA